MSDFVAQLARIGALPFTAVEVAEARLQQAIPARCAGLVLPLLQRRNGFLAFESALQVFGVDQGAPFDFVSWNRADGWRANYGELGAGLDFFAQDIFGGQYAVEESHIIKFDPETGERSRVAESMEGWAELILSDYDYETGYTLASEWQKEYRPLTFGERLYPKLPFVLGGEFETSNLWAATPEKVSGFRGYIAQQLHGRPDGTFIKLNLPGGKTLEGRLQR
ncbi:SMI1/KNR4 family protein [Pseudomarimonas arenosa]|uniref:SMI1/KNR4 family protein n=1 Tax=Pseudomarimonas arenosa TaxID=2774145 RepID=A0AAW3ZRS2_9GAMM|nr:SMI1/KNR4 family protein [Pseudomarimonas arenosa]MBD8527242.1 SMI1/KNR4 family protein [Pseudomarimonas arenosa]